ncbi:MAG: hypothetical protein WD645_03220 [Dehalococcoidia bacterium]
MTVRLAISAGLLLLAAAACSAPPVASTPTMEPSFTPVPTGMPADPTPAPGEFFLDVIAPADESVVSTPDVTVQGQTSVDAVVTVNGETVEIETDGTFQQTVTLLEGPNAIEVIASDFDGNEDTAMISIIYIAES